MAKISGVSENNEAMFMASTMCVAEQKAFLIKIHLLGLLYDSHSNSFHSSTKCILYANSDKVVHQQFVIIHIVEWHTAG
jgi:hypothetical protein